MQNKHQEAPSHLPISMKGLENTPDIKQFKKTLNKSIPAPCSALGTAIDKHTAVLQKD